MNQTKLVLKLALSLLLVFAVPRAAVSGAAVSEAQPISQPITMTLSIQDAVKRALDRNPTVLANRERLEEAQHGFSYAVSQFFPNLSGNASAFKQKAAVNGISVPFGGESYNQYTLQLKLIQPLYQGGAITSGLHAAQKELDIRKKDLEISERDVTAQVINSFYAVMLNQQLLDVLNETLNEQKQTQVLVEKYLKIGRSQLLDVLQIKTQVALLYPKISTAENQMKASASQLMSLLHDNQTEAVHLMGDMVYIEPATVAKVIQLKRERPELTRSRIAIDQFEDKTTVTLASYNPSFDFQALYGKTANSQSDLLNDFSNTWSVGFQLTVPIFAGLASVHEKRVLASQEKQLEYNQDALLDSLAFSEVQAERNLDVATTVLKRSKEASDYSIASLKEAQREFKNATTSYIQVNTSEQNFLDAQTRFIQAKYDYIDAVSKYFVSAGVPISELVRLLSTSK
jgi:outer membrane protein TolC